MTDLVRVFKHNKTTYITNGIFCVEAPNIVILDNRIGSFEMNPKNYEFIGTISSPPKAPRGALAMIRTDSKHLYFDLSDENVGLTGQEYIGKAETETIPNGGFNFRVVKDAIKTARGYGAKFAYPLKLFVAEDGITAMILDRDHKQLFIAAFTGEDVTPKCEMTPDQNEAKRSTKKKAKNIKSAIKSKFSFEHLDLSMV